MKQRRKKPKAYDLANEQYQKLKEKLAQTEDPQEKNIIFRRLINLLEVMDFLNAEAAAQSSAPAVAASYGYSPATAHTAPPATFHRRFNDTTPTKYH